MNLDTNNRLTPSLESEIQKSSTYTPERVIKAVMPLIVMVEPIGKSLELVGGIFSIYQAIKDEDKNIAIKAIKVTFHATSLGLLWVNPLAVSLIQNSWEVVSNTYYIGTSLINRDYKKAALHAFNASEKSFFIASIVIGGPNIVLISMVAKTALELSTLAKFQNKEMFLETAVQSVIVGTKCYGVYKHVDANKQHFEGLYTKIQQKTNLAFSKFQQSLERISTNPLLQNIPIGGLSNSPTQAKRVFTDGIEQTPLILGNDNLGFNSLKGSVYELLNNAKSSILLMSFTFSDPEVIRIINQKASEGLNVQVVIDRDHLTAKSQLHPSIKIGTRLQGEGHLHHKILVVDQKYIWLSSANFTDNAFNHSKNLAMAFFSPDMATKLYQEASDITSSAPRIDTKPLSCSFGGQVLELYVLPHNAPEAPRSGETTMNETGKEKLISLIDNAKHHLKISVDVWTYKDASRAVIEAKNRGVNVDVVVGNKGEDAVKLLIQNGINVKLGSNLHYKFMLVDNETLLNGSPNWSMNTFSRSDESFTVLYNLSEKQLKCLEGTLQVAGLPTSLHLNKIAQVVSGKLAVSATGKIDLANKTIVALSQEVNKIPTGQEDVRLINIAKRISSELATAIPNMKPDQVPGYCLYQGDNYLANVIAIAEKQEKVENAIKYIKNADGIDSKVQDYFQNTLKKLQSGINVPLPSFFHATQNGLDGIIKSKSIRQSTRGMTGPGTYISTNNEGNFAYGNYAFAIDEGCLVDTIATFRKGRDSLGNVFPSLWASVLKDIPVSENNIAFIDTAANDISNVKALLQKQKLDIEVVDRKTSESILKVFEKITIRRELPSFLWKKDTPNENLPHVISRTGV